MKRSLHDYIRVGIVHFMAYPECMGGEGPILETLERLCNDRFFEVVEVTRAQDPALHPAMRALADQARVELCFGAQPVLLGGKLDLNHVDETERRKAVEAVIQAMEPAKALGSESVAVLSGRVCDDYEAGKDRLVNALKTICAAARGKGLRVMLETFDQLPYGKNCLIGPTKDAVDVSRRVREAFPDFGLLLDLSHLPLIGEPARDALELAKKHIVHIHIGNCAMDDPAHPAYGDNHPRFGAPGTRNGIRELVEFLNVLVEIGYLTKRERHIVSFEVKPMPGESAEAVIAGSKRALMEAWRLL